MRLLLQISIFISFLFLFSCSNNIDTNKSEEKEVDKLLPEIIYAEALNEFDNNNYDLAIIKFKEVESKFPLSNEAIQSQIMSAFVEYLRLDYDLAIMKLEKIITRYPSYKNIDYAYYLRAMCYYEQIENPELDGEFNYIALKNFDEIINRFPDSEYAKDSQQKIILIKENIAAKHMNIGMFYLKQKKYLAALKRYKRVVDEHSKTKYIPEALHRLVEIYFTLGMLEEAKKITSVLGYNYPESVWYKYSYKIVEKRENLELKNESIIKKIFKKISLTKTNEE